MPETAAATSVSITQGLSMLRLEHTHLLEEHGADRAVLRQRGAELAEIQAREVDARYCKCPPPGYSCRGETCDEC